jgi:hypothetical protein
VTVVMRNRVTGELKTFADDSNSEDYQALKVELHSDGRPRWEETGQHHLQALKRRVEHGAVRAEDLGDEHEPTTLLTGAVPEMDIIPSGIIDRGQPAAVELDQEAGRAALTDGEDMEPTVMGDTVSAPRAEGTPPPLGDSEFDTEEEVEVGDEPGGSPDLATTRMATGSTRDPDATPSGGSGGGTSSEAQSLADSNDKDALQRMAEAEGVSKSGSKEEIAQRIVQARSEDE